MIKSIMLTLSNLWKAGKRIEKMSISQQITYTHTNIEGIIL
jgi:hypothetical protein